MNRINEFFAAGFNHNSIGIQERNALSAEGDFYEKFTQKCAEQKIRSLVFLNTCNRTEFYGLGNVKKVEGILNNLLPSFDLGEKMLLHSGDLAVQHLFKVASGLDSQLIGDLEILGQFKKAFQHSKKENSLSGYMERLANTCVQSAKEIRSNTQLTSGTTSLSYAAIQLLLKNNLPTDAKILVIGLGKFGKSIAKNINTYLPQNPLTLTNRTVAKSQELASEIGCETLPFEKIFENINQFDVLISAIDSSNLKAEKKHFQVDKKKIVIDLSVPSFFNEELKGARNFQLYTVEDAARIVNDSMQDRKSSIPLAENILLRHFYEFLEWSKFQEKSGPIKEWKSTVESVMKECPHFEKMTDSEQGFAIKKNVRRFVNFVKENDRINEGNNTLLATYVESEIKETCILQCAVSDTVKNTVCSTCPKN